MDTKNAKLIIRGAVAEAGLEPQFQEYLELLQKQYAEIRDKGEENAAAYIMAFAYMSDGLQNGL